MVLKQKKLNSTWHGKDSNKIRQYCSLQWIFLVVPLPMSLYFFGLQYKITNSRGESAGFPRFFFERKLKIGYLTFLSDSNKGSQNYSGAVVAQLCDSCSIVAWRLFYCCVTVATQHGCPTPCRSPQSYGFFFIRSPFLRFFSVAYGIVR